MDKTSCGLGFGGSINSLKTYYWGTAQNTVGHKHSTPDSPAYSSFSISNSIALKTKRSEMTGTKSTGNPSLNLGFGCSPSSSDNSKLSSATTCAMSPTLLKETNEEVINRSWPEPWVLSGL